MAVCVAWRIATVGRSTAAAIKRTTTIFFEALHLQNDWSENGSLDGIEPCLLDALTNGSVEAPSDMGWHTRDKSTVLNTAFP